MFFVRLHEQASQRKWHTLPSVSTKYNHYTNYHNNSKQLFFSKPILLKFWKYLILDFPWIDRTFWKNGSRRWNGKISSPVNIVICAVITLLLIVINVDQGPWSSYWILLSHRYSTAFLNVYRIKNSSIASHLTNNNWLLFSHTFFEYFFLL